MNPKPKPPIDSQSPYSSERPQSGTTEKAKTGLEQGADQLLASISREERDILMQYTNVGAEDVRGALTLRATYGEVFNHLAARVQMLIDEFNSSYDEVSATILLRLLEFREPSANAPSIPHSSTAADSVSGVQKKSSDSESEQRQVLQLPDGIIWQKHPHQGMTAREFARNLTAEGRQMANELLAGKKIDDWIAPAQLPEEYREQGTIWMTSYLLHFLESSPEAKSELQLALGEIREDQFAMTIPSSRPDELASQPLNPQDNIDLLIAGLSGQEVGELWNQEIYERMRSEGKDMELALIMNAEAEASLSHKLQESGLTADVVIARMQGTMSAPTSTPVQPDQLRDDVDHYLGTLSEHGLCFLYYAQDLDDMLRLSKEDPRLDPKFAIRIRTDLQHLMQKHGVSEAEMREKIMDWFDTKKKVPLVEEVTFFGEAEVLVARQEAVEQVQASRDAVIFQITLDPQMSNLEFVNALTVEGKEMLRELLLLPDIKDAQAIQELEKKYGKNGFVMLSMHVADRICASAQARKELCEALKSDEESAVRAVPFARPRAPEEELTVSPWTTQPSAEAATNFERVLDQFLSELSKEEWNELEQDVFREEDDEVRPAGAVTSRLIRRLVKSGEIDFTGDKFKRLLAPRMNRVYP